MPVSRLAQKVLFSAMLSRWEEQTEGRVMGLDQIDIEALRRKLGELATRLHGINYGVDLRIYRIDHAPTAHLGTIICDALGDDAIVNESLAIDQELLLSELNQCISYTGDRWHGPLRPTLASESVRVLKAEIVSKILAVYDAADETFALWLYHGYPLYPVFWDFTFLFRSTDLSLLLIGSSSD